MKTSSHSLPLTAKQTRNLLYMRGFGSLLDMRGFSWLEFSTPLYQHIGLGLSMLDEREISTMEKQRTSLSENAQNIIDLPLKSKDTAQSWPDAATLAEYEKLTPGVAKKMLEALLESFIEEAKLRRENEQKFISALAAAIPRGQYFAIASVCITALLGGYLAWLKYPWASSIIVAMNVVLLVGAFIRSSPRSLPKTSGLKAAVQEQTSISPSQNEKT